MSGIKSVVSTAWNTIKAAISTAMNAIKANVTSAWNSVKAATSSLIGQIYDVIHFGFERAVSYIKGLASQAYSWGRDIIMGIVNGIRSAVGAVTDAVNGVANKIRAVLHFSVPDEGPLTDYESWMPDFMAGLARGIEESRGLVAKAMEGVTSSMAISPVLDAGAVSMTAAGGRGGDSLTSLMQALTDKLSGISGEGGDICIPVYIGQDRIDEIVVRANQRANYRSGGR